MSSSPGFALRTPALGAAVVLAAGLAAALVFRSRPAANLPEWTAADHDPPPAGQAQGSPPARQRQRGQEGGDNLVEVAWVRNCVPCHGERGRGDGPQGPMLRAPDLTRAEWQASVTDEEMLQVIRKGRNKMPGFDLPPAVLQGLVQRIRAGREKR
jgi:mono/diheme cytochrome c family protein